MRTRVPNIAGKAASMDNNSDTRDVTSRRISGMNIAATRRVRPTEWTPDARGRSRCEPPGPHPSRTKPASFLNSAQEPPPASCAAIHHFQRRPSATHIHNLLEFGDGERTKWRSGVAARPRPAGRRARPYTAPARRTTAADAVSGPQQSVRSVWPARSTRRRHRSSATVSRTTTGGGRAVGGLLHPWKVRGARSHGPPLFGTREKGHDHGQVGT